ncbi:hypothetical protein UNDKW_1125 [Undibacterium sp. KW1]|uniref:hypothetical protein n=1 Tax=Undibacterium sp. KW1 TaxID=2058624 RepID=UPI001331C725|nr:hypothetical protein [Undibacterium sp. KW1]BBB59398.1 hypothetical protein UNDKW_1125 [Undibacterium sp. KW1]
MKSLILTVLMLAIAAPGRAEDIANIPAYVEMKVLSCSSALPLIEQKIKGGDYSARELEETRSSAKYFALFTAQPLKEVEYIRSYYDHSVDTYKGRIKTLDKAVVRQFMSPGHDVDFCNTYYLGKTQVFETTKGLSCGEIKASQKHVTVAQCLTDLPTGHGLQVKISDMKKFPAR